MPASVLTYVKTNNVLLTDILNIKNDIVISGEYSFFGSEVDGGEGFCIFFTNAGSSVNVGSPGPGLGFAPTIGRVEYLGNDIFAGTDDSILGVGFDTVGDFASNLTPDITGGLPKPNSITLRHGSTKNFQLIGSESLSAYGTLYDVYGDKYPIATPTPSKTVTGTPALTKTASVGITSTATATFTRTSTEAATPTRTSTHTPTNKVSPTQTLTNGASPTPTLSRTSTPNVTTSKTLTITSTPTKTGLNPPKKYFKVRVTEYGRRVVVSLKNKISDEFVKVYDNNDLNLDLPYDGKVKVGLSYSTGVNESAFYLYNFSINGLGYSDLNTPTPTATRNITHTVSPTQTRTSTSTQTPTNNASATPTPTQTRTQTVTNTVSFTNQPTYTRTQTCSATTTQTITNTQSDTPFATRTQTPTKTKTPTQTRSNTPTQTRTCTITNTQTRTPTQTGSRAKQFCASCESSYKFVFESKWGGSFNAGLAVNVMINNAREGLNNDTNSLINISNEDTSKQVPNDFKSSYAQSFFFNDTPIAGQNFNYITADGQSSWMVIPMKDNNADTGNTNYDPRTGISSNVFQALNLLLTTGDTLSTTLVNIDKKDDDDFNIWGIDGLDSNYVASIFDKDLNDRYFPNFNNTGNILYNTDYIEGDTTRDNFASTPDSYRIIPDTRYITINDSDIYIKFSYGSELIYYRGNNQNGYWGARLTLFTNAIQ